MKKIRLEDMSLDDLVDSFAEIGIAQDDAVFRDENATYNRLYEKMQAVGEELQRRGGGARLALQRLYIHPNIQVRLQAATWTLGVAPEAARKVLQSIHDWKLYPQDLGAGMLLAGLDDGSYKPE
jgi:hypothetical protein